MNNDLTLLSNSLKTELLQLEIALAKLETDIAICQTGSDKGPYWNGLNAYGFYKSSIGFFEHDKNLLKNLKKCSEYLDSCIK